MSRRHRLWIAAVAGLAALGTVQAGILEVDLGWAGPAPTDWVFGPILEGDRGLYRLETYEMADGQHRTRYADEAFQPFEVRGHAWVRDEAGHWRDTVRVDIQGGSHGHMDGIPVQGKAWSAYTTEWNLHAFDAHTDELVAVHRSAFLDAARSPVPAGMEGVNESEETVYLTGAGQALHPIERTGPDDLCGLWPAGTVNGDPSATTPRFRPGCMLAGRQNETYAFSSDGAEVIDGEWCLRFTASNEAGDRTVRVWRCAGVPYAQRVELQHNAFQDTFTRYDLVSFHRGAVPLARPSAPAATALPGLDWSPAEPWGPPSQGLAHPFPLKEAWDLAPSLNATVASYVGDHPSARVVDIRWEHKRTPSSRSYAWTYQALAETEGVFGGLRVTVERIVAADATTTQVVEAERSTPGPEYARLALEGLPTQWPTIASLMAYAEAATGTDLEGPGTLGWEMAQAQVPMPCVAADGLKPDVPRCRTVTTLTLENHLARWDGVDANSWHHDQTRSFVGFSPDGALVWYGSQLRTFDEAGAAAAPPVPDQGTGPQAISVQGPDWSPTPAAARTTAIVAAAAILGYFAPAIRDLLGWVLFSRVTESGALRHPARQQIVAAVRARPGVGAEELQQDLGLPRGTLRHHLRTLKFVGLVVEVSAGNQTSYFIKGARDRRVMTAVSLARSDGARRLLATVRSAPGLRGQDLAARLGLEPTTVSHHARRFQRQGIVRAERDGKSRRYYPTELLDQVLLDAGG